MVKFLQIGTTIEFTGAVFFAYHIPSERYSETNNLDPRKPRDGDKKLAEYVPFNHIKRGIVVGATYRYEGIYNQGYQGEPDSDPVRPWLGQPKRHLCYWVRERLFGAQILVHHTQLKEVSLK